MGRRGHDRQATGNGPQLRGLCDDLRLGVGHGSDPACDLEQSGGTERRVRPSVRRHFSWRAGRGQGASRMAAVTARAAQGCLAPQPLGSLVPRGTRAW